MYSRKCVEEAENANSNSCLADELFSNDDPNIQLISCETCREDGCNNQIKNYFVTELEESNFGLTSILINVKLVLGLLIIILFS